MEECGDQQLLHDVVPCRPWTSSPAATCPSSGRSTTPRRSSPWGRSTGPAWRSPHGRVSTWRSVSHRSRHGRAPHATPMQCPPHPMRPTGLTLTRAFVLSAPFCFHFSFEMVDFPLVAPLCDTLRQFSYQSAWLRVPVGLSPAPPVVTSLSLDVDYRKRQTDIQAFLG